MKFLSLSDLHIGQEYYSNISKYKRILNNNIKEEYDAVLISGDVFEHTIMKTSLNPFKLLNILFDNKMVIFCLGNHEFAYEKYKEVLYYWKSKQNEYEEKNIICLDVNNSSYIINDKIQIVGNVFWYDFSLNKNRYVMKGEILDGWLDSTIADFDPIECNEINKNEIINSLKNNKYNNILLTHMVPHWSLNTFSIEQENSPYNAYSGNFDFLKYIKDFNVKYAICGHTHKRECKEIYGINCINIGNDYYFRTNKIEHAIIEC